MEYKEKNMKLKEIHNKQKKRGTKTNDRRIFTQMIKESDIIKDEKSENEQIKCIICVDNKKKVAFGCGHVMMCVQCTLNQQNQENPRCPFCRCIITKSMIVYL